MASRISAVTSIGVFIMAILIGVIVEHAMAPHLGVGYRLPAGSSHGKKPPAAAIRRAAPGVHPTSRAPAVKHRAASVASVPGAVRLTMLADRGPVAEGAFGGLRGTQPIVNVLRHDGSFAFGTSAIGVPSGVAAMPQTALFLAKANGSRWHVALDGTSAFTQMLDQAPGRLIAAPEKQLLAHYNATRQAAMASTGGVGGQPRGQSPPGKSGSKPSPSGSARTAPSPSGSAMSPAPGSTAGTATQTGLALPWKASQSWMMVSTPGKRPAGADPLAQASFTGGDGRVLSAGSGRLYRFCVSRSAGHGDALIEVIHADGSATEYYQIDHETTARDGSPVRQGTYLGRTGTSLACGGSLGRPEVEFSLLRAGSRSLDGAAVGGWTFRETLQPLRIWVQRGNQQVLPGSLLQNLGSLVNPGAL